MLFRRLAMNPSLFFSPSGISLLVAGEGMGDSVIGRYSFQVSSPEHLFLVSGFHFERRDALLTWSLSAFANTP